MAGLIVDLSLGGAGIETAAPTVEDFTLVFAYGGRALSLPCSRRHSRDLWARTRTHAQFKALTPDQQDELQQVMESLIQSNSAERRYNPFARTVRRLLRL